MENTTFDISFIQSLSTLNTDVACGPLQIHDHALKIQGIQNRTYHLADTLQFECERGYRLQGQSSIICQTNGTWSANAPTCTPIPTGELKVKTKLPV